MDEAIVVEIIKESPANWRFILQYKTPEPIRFIPGQLIQLAVEDIPCDLVTRNFSVASWPDGTNKLEIIVTNIVGGRMSNYLFNKCKVGDVVAIGAPVGGFILPTPLERDVVFVCTGSGISPFRSMINYVTINKVSTKQIYMVFGCRTQEDILYRAEMEALERINPNFHYIPVLSREEWDGANGYVHQQYLEIIKDMENKPLFYLCGWSGMIDDVRTNLTKLGYQLRHDIRIDLFG